jgi:hypothetical protein
MTSIKRPERLDGPGAAAGFLSLAAAPVFLLMALLSGAFAGEPMAMMCGAAGSPLAGMPAMYLLMGVFHSGPWLRLMARGWHRRRV